jgi:hypothetical protein
VRWLRVACLLRTVCLILSDHSARYEEIPMKHPSLDGKCALPKSLLEL